jgi:hypothetical protein
MRPNGVEKQVRPKKWLPTEYQEVEYIQSSGTQYFVVWTSFKTSYKSVIDFQMTQTWGDQIIIWFNLTPYRYWINAYASKFKVITWSTGGWSNTISEDTNRHIFTIDKSTATVDSNNYTISWYTDVTVNWWIWVFAHNDIWVGNYFASVKIYNLEIYDENWVIIYHLVPCYRKSDSVIGMYDLVNDQFYTNSWTWTFTKWPDV